VGELALPVALTGLFDRRAAAFLLGGVSVTALGAANGGYYPGAWGWGAIAFLWAAGIALGVSSEFSRTALLFASLGVALLVWTILSGFWSSDLTATGLAAQRQLLYAATVVGGLTVVRRSSVDALLAGVWAGVVLICGWGLLTRLLPDHIGIVDPFSGYRLSGPIGYWNSFGLLAAIGTLIAIGLAARASLTWVRALAAASLPVLLVAQYYTFSRGAWLSLAVALVVLVVIDSARLQLLLVMGVAGWSGLVAVAFARSYPPLTTQGSSLAAEVHAGHHVVAELAVLAAAAALSIVGLAFAERRVEVAHVVRRVAGGSLVAIVAVGAATFTVRFGAPWTAVNHAWHTFATGSSAGGRSNNLNGRLLSFSGSGRVVQWHVAWDQVKSHPWLGGGAGTWVDYWVQYRPVASTIHNVHNEYLETLAELGPVGLALLLAFVLTPFAALRSIRRMPLASTAAAALAAFAVHSIVDWDWQLAGVTVPALLCGVALLAAVDGRPVRMRFATPVALGAVGILLAAAIWVTLGRVELAKISSDAHSDRLGAAESAARRASTLEPWSSEGWTRLGSAAVGAGDVRLADSAYTKALARDRSNWQLWVAVAQVSTGAAVSQALTRAHELNPLGAPSP
jgi:hypothetical protein